MIFVFIIISIALVNLYYSKRLLRIENNKCKELEGEVKEYRKIKRKLNKWRQSQDKIIQILDNGLLRLRDLRLKRLEKK
jgi:hypothetical protein